MKLDIFEHVDYKEYLKNWCRSRPQANHYMRETCEHFARRIPQLGPISFPEFFRYGLISFCRERHFACKNEPSAATSLDSQKVLNVAQRPRLRAFFSFSSFRSKSRFFAPKALSRQKLTIPYAVSVYSID